MTAATLTLTIEFDTDAILPTLDVENALELVIEQIEAGFVCGYINDYGTKGYWEVKS